MSTTVNLKRAKRLEKLGLVLLSLAVDDDSCIDKEFLFSIKYISYELECDEKTIKRDLNDYEKEGVLKQRKVTTNNKRSKGTSLYITLLLKDFKLTKSKIKDLLNIKTYYKNMLNNK